METTNEPSHEQPLLESAGSSTPASGGGKVKHGLSTGSLPQGATWIRALTHQFKRALENAVVAEKGEVSIVDACAINTATRAERLALLANRWLRIEAGNMLPAERLAFAREVLKASEARDRAVRSLNLGASADPYAALYSQPYSIAAGGLSGPEPSQEPTSAPEPPESTPGALPGMPPDGAGTGVHA